ncbi:MAG: Kelch repeat-containing protein [Gemmatimonadaceae bacterium]
MTYLLRGVYGATVILTAGLRSGDTTLPADGRIERVASLGTPRAAHTTTALPSGQLLVTGGMGPGGGSLSSAELVDVSTAGVKAIVPMADARAGHTAIALPDGRVVLAGGYNGTYLNSVEVFDPGAQRFRITGHLNEGRSGHTATRLRDGRILVIGGVGRGWSFLSSAEVFDPNSGRSEAVGPMSVPRESHTATLLPDGRVLVVGGHRGRRETMEVYASSEIFDPATRRFQSAGYLATARHKHDAVLLADGRVLVLGGADRTDRRHYATTEVYNAASAAFETGPSMGRTRYKIQGTAVKLASGDLLVPSGAREAELLDRRSFTFRSVAGKFPAAFFFATATRVSTGDVAIVGGYDPRNQNTGGVWLFRVR